MNTYYDWLSTNLKQITDNLLTDSMSPDNYPPYEITSRNPHIHYEQDDDLTDAASFGTMLTNSMEEMATEINDNDIQPTNLFPATVHATNPSTHQNIPGDQQNQIPQHHQATYAEITAQGQGE